MGLFKKKQHERVPEFVSNPSSFGKLNAVFCLELPLIGINEMVNEITRQLHPIETHVSAFNLVNNEAVFNHSLEAPLPQDTILKIIFAFEHEQVIVDYYNGLCSIEHVFHFTSIQYIRAQPFLKKYLDEKESSCLILGFELSIAIDSFAKSLQLTLEDESMYPIVRISKVDKSYIRKDYYFQTEITAIKLKEMYAYLHLMGI